MSGTSLRSYRAKRDFTVTTEPPPRDVAPGAEALRTDKDPDRLSFLHAVRVVRRKPPLLAAFPPQGQARPA